MTTRIKTLIIIAMLSLSVIQAQDSLSIVRDDSQSDAVRKDSLRNEFSFYGGGGISTLYYDLPTGLRNDILGAGLSLGGHAGIGYMLHLSPSWGINLDVGVSWFTARAKLNGFADRYPATDIDGNSFDFRTKISQTERQNAILLDVPLTFRYVQPKKSGWWFAVGGKAGIPLIVRSFGNATLVNSGYYEYEDYEYTQPRRAGFGTFDVKVDAQSKLKIAYSALLEGGRHWIINDRWRLYAGIYIDFGINNIAQTSANEHIVNFDASHADVYKPRSVLDSRYTDADNVAKPYVEHIRPIAAGIKIRITPWARKRKAKAPVSTSYDPFADSLQAKKGTVNNDIADSLAMVKKKSEELPDVIKQLVQDMSNALFETNSSTLSAESSANLVAIAEWLKEEPEVKILIEGHTDNVGKAAYNQGLSERRAASVKRQLVELGIAADRLSTVGYGLTRPIADNNTEEGRQKNRRVEMKIMK